MSGKRKVFEVDGRETTYEKLADELGISLQALRISASRFRGKSMQEIADMYRSGQIRRRVCGAQCVHGKWMTVDEAAAELGISPYTLRSYKYKWKERTLEATVDRILEMRANHRANHRPGPAAAKHRVRGRMVTVAEAAGELGVPPMRLYAHIHYHRCSLEEAVKRCEKARAVRARNRIVRILTEGRG